MHSPLGGSAAARFLACPGSYRLISSIIDLPEADPLIEDYRGNGSKAHAIAAEALASELDAWEIEQEGAPLDADHLMSIQSYLDFVRSRQIPGATQFIECEVGEPSLHKWLFGSLDWAQIDLNQKLLEIADYKHGVGVCVSATKNPQLMYYAFCKLLEHPEVTRVRMFIVQPRGFHPDGTIRRYECNTEEILSWGYAVLIPGMKEAEISSDLRAGKHCQFCPAKLFCTAALAIYDEATDQEVAGEMSDARLAERFDKIEVVQFVRKAIEEEMRRRLLLGREFSVSKLVLQKVDRVLKDGAEIVFQEMFGDEAFTSPVLKSPAQLEKLTGGKELVKHWAYTPPKGFVVARMDDKRKGVKPPSATDVFKQYNAGETDADKERVDLDPANSA